MKRIISLISILALVCSMFSINVFADYTSDLTLKVTKEGTTVAADTESLTSAVNGEEFVASVLLGSTSGLQGLSFKIKYDPADITIGTAATADQALIDYGEYVGVEGGWADEAALIKDMTGKVAYVSDEYHTTYGGYPSNKQIATPTIILKESEGTLAFGYSRDSAMSSVAVMVTKNMHVGGMVLKVNTEEKKQTTISIVEATACGSDKVDTACTINNTITLNLNGYGEVVEEETPAEKINLLTANGVAKSDVYVTNINGSKYYVDSALVFVSSVDKGNTPKKTVITCDDFADKKLEIEATHTQDINGLTYFAAAMSSIKETNYGKTFKATAYVTNADGEEVVGVPATGIFTK